MQAMCPNTLMHMGLRAMDGAPDTKAARSCLRLETSRSATRYVGYEHSPQRTARAAWGKDWQDVHLHRRVAGFAANASRLL